MDQTAKVKSVQALVEWKSVLKRFVLETQAAIGAAEQEIRRTEEWLQERLIHWHRQVERCYEEVSEAKRALEYCREDEESNCSQEEEELSDARHRLHRAQVELDNARRWKQRVNEMAAEYRTQAQRLSRLMNTDISQGDAFLGRKIAEIEAYLAVAAEAVGAVASSPQSQSTAGTVYGAAAASGTIVGSPEEVQQLQNALSTLEASKNGHSIGQAVRKYNTTVHFGDIPPAEPGHDPPIAAFYRNNNEIVLNRKYLYGASAAVLAAHLAHEGTHCQWWHENPQRNSLWQEYEAFKNEVYVWQELKGTKKDNHLDSLSKIILERDKLDAIDLIKFYYDYRDLPYVP